MRVIRLLLVMLLTPVLTLAQTPASAISSTATIPHGPPDPEPIAVTSAVNLGQVVFGGRFNTVSGDEARFERYQDLRSGPTLDLFRYYHNTSSWTFSSEADHVGYRDQHFDGRYERYGRIKASLDWDRIPLFYSEDTRTPYTQTSPGVFRLNDAVQAGVEAKTLTTAAYLPDVRQFDLRSRRNVATARFLFSATPTLDLSVNVLSTARKGAQPWGASFGFSDAVELPVPIDQRINDLNAAAEWSGSRGMARLAFDGSWFTNHTPTLVWDNPLRLTDTTNATAYSTGDGSSQGRMSLWPDSSLQTVSASGAVNLPRRTRAFGYVSVGTWIQDEALLPHTINTAIVPIPLARSAADAEARIVAMLYRVTSRPTPRTWLNAQYRLYDYDNRTPRFAVDQYVRLDGTVAPSVTGGSEPFGYTRHFGDFEASYSPLTFVALRAGYSVERDHRTFRFFDETTEHTVRGSVDSTGFTWGSVRLQYDFGVRTGHGFDEEAFSEIGEQVSLRQFDISDRTRNRLSAIVQVVPRPSVGLNGTVAVGNDHRPNASFGLQDNDVLSFTVGIDLTPSEAVLIGASYGFDNYSANQRSRQANPGVQFDDPTRDWLTDMDENVHTIGTSIEFPHLMARSSLRFGYDAVFSRARYLYELAPASTLPPVQQLPALVNQIQRASAEFRHTLAERLALAIGYAFDGYDVEDFARSPGTLNSPLIPTYVNLMYELRPYSANTGYARLSYTW